MSGWAVSTFERTCALVLGLGLTACIGPSDVPARGAQAESTEGSRDEQNREPPALQTVSALGRLEPQGEVISVGVPLGHRLDRLVVVEGQQVESGEVLAYLDSYPERLADRDYHATLLLDTEKRLKAETLHGEAIIREAEVRIEQLELLQPLEIRAQEAEVRMIEAELATSKSDLERMQSLLARKIISPQEFDHQSLLVSRNQSRLENSTANLNRLMSARTVNLDMAREQLGTARAGLLRTQSALQLESLRAGLKQADARLERSIIRSPSAGQILRIVSRPGESLDEKPILEMGNTGEMLAVAEVYETEIGRIRVGQTARVMSPALSRTLIGSIVQIGKTIHKNDVLNIDPTADTDARVVEVKIRLDESQPPAALVNLQVDVQISVAR